MQFWQKVTFSVGRKCDSTTFDKKNMIFMVLTENMIFGLKNMCKLMVLNLGKI